MSRSDNLKLFAWAFGALAVIVGWFHFYSSIKTARHLDQTINRWRADYHLSHEQAERIRAIEEKFHGSGNPFFRQAHTPAERIAHHREMANVVGPEQGERFFAALEGHGGKAHRKR